MILNRLGLDLVQLALYIVDTLELTGSATFLKENTMLTRFNEDSKTYKLFQALHQGQHVSASQAHKRFGIKNATATISVIRQRGYAIYANQRTAGNGVEVTEYRHGEASRKMVAIAYRAMSMGLV